MQVGTAAGVVGVAALAGFRPADAVNIPLQLYSVRDDMAKDPLTTLQAVAKMGYTQVEHANYKDRKFYGYAPAEFKKLLADLGMTMPTGHVVFGKDHWNSTVKAVTDSWKHAVADAATAGQTYLISPWFPWDKKDLDDVKRGVEAWNYAGRASADGGVRFGFHNHHQEFVEKIKGQYVYDLMLKESDLRYVCQQLDICNMAVAKVDPMTWLKRYPKYFEQLHVKDLDKTQDVSTTLGDGRLNIAVTFPTHIPAENRVSGAALDELKSQARTTRELSRKYKLLFTQDGHTTGSVTFADALGLLGPDAILSHATEFTDEEIATLARTRTRIVHNPSANAATRRRFQLVELLDAGVTVMLGSDGVAPDRSYDMFRHMFQAMRYHRFYWRDTNVLPAGKVLEMVTVDAAKALGMEKDIGSLEVGKKADIILIDWWRPHMVPMNMPLYRVAYFANGNDVSTVLVNGRVLMRDRRVLSVNEDEVLTMAEREANAAIARSGLKGLVETPEGFWGRSRLPKQKP